jgi:hypothetical protein
LGVEAVRGYSWVLGIGRWALGVGRWMLDIEIQARGVGCWVLGVGRWAFERWVVVPMLGGLVLPVCRELRRALPLVAATNPCTASSVSVLQNCWRGNEGTPAVAR